ncbi:MAG: hypothetical protein WD904_06000 [Dehalococcoidia bacterium]
MWDILITLGNLIFLPSLLPTLLDSRSYIPRKTTGPTVFGLLFIIAGLTGQGLVLSPIVTTAVAAMWLFIFIFRGRHTV